MSSLRDGNQLFFLRVVDGCVPTHLHVYLEGREAWQLLSELHGRIGSVAFVHLLDAKQSNGNGCSIQPAIEKKDGTPG